MSRGSRVRSPPEADTFTAVHGEIGRVLVRYDFNRLAVYLSFRTPIAGKLPPLSPTLAAPLRCYSGAGRESVVVLVCNSVYVGGNATNTNNLEPLIGLSTADGRRDGLAVLINSLCALPATVLTSIRARSIATVKACS